MPKFRKKPVEIEAHQYADSASKDFICLWAAPFVTCVDGHMTVATKEGPLRAPIGSWIIRGVQGEFYPCDPEIFAQTYEQAEPERNPPCPHTSKTRIAYATFWTCGRCGAEIPVSS